MDINSFLFGYDVGLLTGLFTIYLLMFYKRKNGKY